jgi:drug/metabolite transporter (DMT)-like permease
LVAIRTKKNLTVQHCSALILTLTGTFFIWISVEWKHELWMIWFALIASIIQVLCLTEWFAMLDKLKENQFLYIVRGITLGVCIMFIVMIIWTPQHLEAAFVYRTDSWFFILVASSITISCKYWVLSYFLKNRSSDSVAIFECIHPIATLCLEVFKGHTKFEWQDIVSICLYTIGWILYPK